ncbi:MAG: hypothetical protein KDD35_02635 [Bdellovibrionales bacterium]|nr:hypothetical protein [Bdellovibrionales bacterium]
MTLFRMIGLAALALTINLSNARPCFAYPHRSSEEPGTNIPSSLREEIEKMVNRLNRNEPDLFLSIVSLGQKKDDYKNIIMQIRKLEEIVKSGAHFEPAELNIISCTHVACGGGGGGCSPPVCFR